VNWLKVIFRKYGQLVLGNPIHAQILTVILVVVPLTGWLAASAIALATLRKGWKCGAVLLIPSLVAECIVLNTTVSLQSAFIGSFLSFVPCYLSAGVLRLTTSWLGVSRLLFLLAVLVMSFIHVLAPEFFMQQFAVLREIINQLQLESASSVLAKGTSAVEQTILANYIVGIQAASIISASLVSLVFARFVQSRLYFPEGFRQEMRSIRATKIDVLVFLVVAVAAKQQFMLAMNMFPILYLYFLFAVLSLWLDCTARRGLLIPMLLVSIGLGFIPQVMLNMVVLLGAIDALVNIRLYLNHHPSTTTNEVK
jgi:hypothetical protein